MRAKEIGFAALAMAVIVLCDDYTRQNTTRSVRQLPSPCNNPHFGNPVYSLDNVTASKRYDSNVYDKAVGQLNFTLRDTTNNYSLRCVWGPLGRLDSSFPDWLSLCVPEDAEVAAPDEFQTRTLMQVKTFSSYPEPHPIEIVQLWMCGQENGSYPLVFQASASPQLNVSCPAVTEDGAIYACNITTSLPLITEAEWTPPTLPSGSAKLVPRPDPPYVPQGLDPPPEQDCTDMSLTHPDWTVEMTSETSSLNLTITSRATKVQVACQSNSSTGGVTKLSCLLMSGLDPFGSRPTFTVEYTPETKSLRIQHDWVCGDSRGTYKTEYRAAKTVTLPLICDNNASCKLENPLVIQGELLRPLKLTPTFFPPPPNANVPGCTARSAATPGWEVTGFNWTEQTALWYHNDRPTRTDVVRRLHVSLRNTANNFTESCWSTATVHTEDRPNEWWIWCRDGKGRDTRGNVNGLPGEGQRDIETRVNVNLHADGEVIFSVNQTWYCNDTDMTKPTSYQAHGSIKTTHCTWQNQTNLRPPNCGNQPLTKCRQDVSTRYCAFNDVDNNPVSITASLPVYTTSLPEHALTDPDPLPGTYSCTSSSIGRPVTFTLLNRDGNDLPYLTTDTYSPYARDINYINTKLLTSLQNSALPRQTYTPTGQTPFSAQNPFPLNGIGDYDARLTPYLPAFEPSNAYRYNEGMGRYNHVVDWAVRFDAITGYLEISHSWECVDKSPGWRTVFTGTWNGFVKMNCTFPELTTATVDKKKEELGLVCRLGDGDGGGLTVVPKVTIEPGGRGM
ncbi:hypothetical protein V8F33_011135 [Rhypophila sp. PSN 637]